MTRNYKTYQQFIRESEFSDTIKNSLLEALNLEIIKEASDNEYKKIIDKYVGDDENVD